MKRLYEAVQISPVPEMRRSESLNFSKDGDKLSILSTFSKNYLYQMGIGILLNKSGFVSEDKLKKFTKRFDGIYKTDVYDRIMSGVKNIMNTELSQDEYNKIIDVFSKIGKSFLEKYINNFHLNDDGMMIIYQQFSFSDFIDDDSRIVLFRGSSTEPSVWKNDLDPMISVLTISGLVDPCNVDWIKSVRDYINGPDRLRDVVHVTITGDVILTRIDTEFRKFDLTDHGE